MEKVLSGRIALITGANQGFGLEVARTYLAAGADLMLCARNAELLESARAELAGSAEAGQSVFAMAADVSNAHQVRELVDTTIDELGGLHILVNNAGVYGPKGQIEDVDWNAWIQAIEINVYGSVLMCKTVLPHFKAQAYGKIIQLSGGGATSPMPRISAYAVSKAAIVRFAETLAEEVRGTGIDVNSIAPGALNTRMLDEVLEAGPEKVGKDFYERAVKQKDSGGVPLSRGAELAVFLASGASDGITGKLISAVWDNWELWPNYQEKLSGSDVYTLRRIVGRDRDFAAGDK
jgi:NAD(P)-dependent dehydrogenase (short-subunit alcohol dehydrogenase family)